MCNKAIIDLGGSPGLLVMGGDSHSKGRGFESRHCILDGHFFTYICCKNLKCLFEKTENERKRGRGWPVFFKKKLLILRAMLKSNLSVFLKGGEFNATISAS